MDGRAILGSEDQSILLPCLTCFALFRLLLFVVWAKWWQNYEKRVQEQIQELLKQLNCALGAGALPDFWLREHSVKP